MLDPPKATPLVTVRDLLTHAPVAWTSIRDSPVSATTTSASPAEFVRVGDGHGWSGSN